MASKKIFILLPDGIGLRNFAYTNFHTIGLEKGFDITFWNNTPFNISELGYKEIKINNPKNHPFTEIYKNARKQIELNLFIKRFNDTTYNSYRFPFSTKTTRQKIKTFLTKRIISKYNSEARIKIILKKITDLEKKTNYFDDCLKTLQKEKPDFIFCTNQRPMSAIAPIEAAKQLGIPTATFIFSWDNLPKATLVIDTDYYLVWSEFMKKELLKYYPDINEKQIVIVGTPQFENHFDLSLKVEKEVFFKNNNLDLDKKYICFSGDDVTTSPNDPQYLKDTALAVRNLNKNGFNLGIVFRRCPVDFSDRFDNVLEDYQDVIVPINPLWKKIGEGWNTILPTHEDMILQTNTIAHTEFVINLGSSMVFDYVCYQKPCVYVNYDVPQSGSSNWSVEKIYKYIHFRSMPTNNSVIWFNNANEIEQKIQSVLEGKVTTVNEATAWFEIINQKPANHASERIWDFINTLTEK
ncbi:MAG TPA: UDP-glycosyltransferase [Flavobacterium sp.]|nr:UDP-glycosyltransferase [Flavobacterium sp.]